MLKVRDELMSHLDDWAAAHLPSRPGSALAKRSSLNSSARIMCSRFQPDIVSGFCLLGISRAFYAQSGGTVQGIQIDGTLLRSELWTTAG
jgi:hypothetical protein